VYINTRLNILFFVIWDFHTSSLLSVNVKSNIVKEPTPAGTEIYSGRLHADAARISSSKGDTFLLKVIYVNVQYVPMRCENDKYFLSNTSLFLFYTKSSREFYVMS
jgi:hypothetical protein